MCVTGLESCQFRLKQEVKGLQEDVFRKKIDFITHIEYLGTWKYLMTK